MEAIKSPKLSKEERFKAAVLVFDSSSKDTKDLYIFAIAVFAATTFGSGLIFSQIETIIKENYDDH